MNCDNDGFGTGEFDLLYLKAIPTISPQSRRDKESASFTITCCTVVSLPHKAVYKRWVSPPMVSSGNRLEATPHSHFSYTIGLFYPIKFP